jgi:hypothetical protein
MTCGCHLRTLRRKEVSPESTERAEMTSSTPLARFERVSLDIRGLGYLGWRHIVHGITPDLGRTRTLFG